MSKFEVRKLKWIYTLCCLLKVWYLQKHGWWTRRGPKPNLLKLKETQGKENNNKKKCRFQEGLLEMPNRTTKQGQKIVNLSGQFHSMDWHAIWFTFYCLDWLHSYSQYWRKCYKSENANPIWAITIKVMVIRIITSKWLFKLQLKFFRIACKI